MTWHAVVSWDDCPEGATEHVVAGEIVALVRVGDEVWALDGICAHQGGPLGQGKLDRDPQQTGGACYLTCPWHGWQYDVATGKHRTSPICQAAYEVKVEAGQVVVRMEGGAPEA